MTEIAIAPRTPFTADTLIALVPPGLDEDLRQDTIVDLLEAQPRTLDEVHRVIRKTRERNKSASRRERARMESSPIDPNMVFAVQELNHTAHLIRDILDAANEADRALLTLRYLNAKSASETASMLGVSLRTMSGRVGEALNRTAEVATRVLS